MNAAAVLYFVLSSTNLKMKMYLQNFNVTKIYLDKVRFLTNIEQDSETNNDCRNNEQNHNTKCYFI